MALLLSVNLHSHEDVVTARQRAAQIAGLLEFDVSEQTRIATAVSEIARNAFRYTGGGWVLFEVEVDSQPQRLVVRVEDHGPGIARLDDVLSGKYQSSTGLALGIVGAQRLMDRFSIDSSAAGTCVVLEKTLPARAPLVTSHDVHQIVNAVGQRPPEDFAEGMQQQNQELLRALDELHRKQQELTSLTSELENTNGAVVALYAQLDEKADDLRRADEMKSRFLSNLTHEFRTPVNAIIGLCNLMLDDRHIERRAPGPELGYIRKAADELSELLNDLIDLAKMEAGKTAVRAAEFEVQQLFGAIGDMLRPLLVDQPVALVFEEAADLPSLHTDEAKVSQILRHLISNALKFTERGEVRVSTRIGEPTGTVTFSVADTGIGIAPEDQSRIFEEFGQVANRLQRGSRGSGLGLPLSRRLAELLGGTVTVASKPGVGSTFSLTLPAGYADRRVAAAPFEWTPEPGKLPLLIIEDAPDPHVSYDKILKSSPFQIYPAYSAAEATGALETIVPAAIILDLVLAGAAEWDLLVRLKRDVRTRQIPVVIVSALGEHEKGLALGADAYLVKPLDRRTLLDTLSGLRARLHPAVRVLAIDDEEMARYVVRQCLPVPAFDVTEAASAEEGLRRARAERPDIILLDLVMPGMTGQRALEALRADPATRDIPIVISTAKKLRDQEKRTLLQHAAAVFWKGDLSRKTLPGVVRTALGRSP